MKTISKTALVALVTATLGLGAAAPTFAQQAPPAPTQSPAPTPDNFRDHQQDGGPRHFGGGDFLSVERGAEAIEIALVRLSHRIELTDTQQPLFDAFKTAALSAATDFTTATEGLRPTPPTEGEAPAMPDLAQRLENGIALQRARLDALEAVQPSAVAFFDSLTDEQKADLMPQRPDRPGGPGVGGPGFGGPRGDHGPAKG